MVYSCPHVSLHLVPTSLIVLDRRQRGWQIDGKTMGTAAQLLYIQTIEIYLPNMEGNHPNGATHAQVMESEGVGAFKDALELLSKLLSTIGAFET